MHFGYWIRSVLLSFLVAAGVAGCTQSPIADAPADSKAFPHTQLRWDSASIPVCWETTASAVQRGWVRDRVNAEYQNTSLQFTGWGTCNGSSPGIRIDVQDVQPHTTGLGRQLDGVAGGMVLNFTFNSWGTECKTMTKHCIEVIAVHEFGHAIGLAHEQNRSDTDKSLCTDLPQGSDGDLFIGAWDSRSIMNYCNPVWNNGGHLSAGDLLGIRFLYERYLQFQLQSGTGLGEVGPTFELLAGNYDGDALPDIFAISKRGTGSHTTEVHVLSGASSYRNFVLQTRTPLPEAGDEFEFKLADWDRDARSDLVAILKRGTGSGSTEVHILSGNSNYQEFLLQTGTGLAEVGPSWEFGLADWDHDAIPDLFCLSKEDTGTGSTEVHILTGAKNFQEFLLQTGTALGKTDRHFDLEVADWDQDGWTDIVAVAKASTGTGSTEVHVLDGASKFSAFSFQRGTLLAETDDTFSFAVADMNRSVPGLELIAFMKNHTGTRSTEVHVLRTW